MTDLPLIAAGRWVFCVFGSILKTVQPWIRAYPCRVGFLSVFLTVLRAGYFKQMHPNDYRMLGLTGAAGWVPLQRLIH